MSGVNILEVKEVSKAFTGVQALDKVNFSCEQGEIHALIGENGAGKSTLLKIISGMYTADSGEIIFDGGSVHFKNPEDAKKKGIAMVYQELSILPELTVAQNVYLNEEQRPTGKTKGFHLINEKALSKAVLELAGHYGIEVDPDIQAKYIPLAKQQMIEILKAMVLEPKLIILDEPTSALSKEEVAKLFEIMKNMKAKGITIIFISHRLEEIFAIADRVSVFKDGKYIGTEKTADINEDILIRMMVGRELNQIFPDKKKVDGEDTDEVIFSVKDLGYYDLVKHVSLEIRKGEIVSIAGLQGQGQGEFLKVIAGILHRTSGEIYIKGEKISTPNPDKAIQAGIIYAPEDRKMEGLCLTLSVKNNIAAASLKQRRKGVFVDQKAESEEVLKQIDSMAIKTSGPNQAVGNLSGGNQQKVVIGKSLAIRPKVLLFNEPTRGIDVQAKQDIYTLLRNLANEGIAVLMYSSDMLEVIGLSDRVLPMYEGEIITELRGDQLTEENIMRASVGRGGGAAL